MHKTTGKPGRLNYGLQGPSLLSMEDQRIATVVCRLVTWPRIVRVRRCLLPIPLKERIWARRRRKRSLFFAIIVVVEVIPLGNVLVMLCSVGKKVVTSRQANLFNARD